MLLLIGSFALREHMPVIKTPLDVDIIGSYDNVMAFASKQNKISECYPIDKGKKMIIKTRHLSVTNLPDVIEAEITWENSTAAEIFELVKNDPETVIKNIRGQYFMVPSLNVLYMLKMTHRFLKNSPHFLKTMDDIHRMRDRGAVFVQEYADVFKRRELETYNYSHPKLNVSKKEFFNGDGVKYVYDHDSIHESTKILEKPAYLFFKLPDEDVACSKELFWDAPEIVRIAAVLEESYVLALERSQIPFSNKLTPKGSFDIALMKVCTSITSGWFRTFAWENYNRAQSLYNDLYVEKFWYDVNRGAIKPLKE